MIMIFARSYIHDSDGSAKRLFDEAMIEFNFREKKKKLRVHSTVL